MWQDNKVIMIRHGGYCSRVSANRLLPVKEELRQRIEAGEIAGADVEKEVMQEAQASNDNNENTQDDDSSRERGNIVQQPEINNTITDNTEIQNDENDTNESSNTEEIEHQETDHAEDNNQAPMQKKSVGRPKTTKSKSTSNLVFKQQERIMIKVDNSWKPGIIMNRAGKASCKASNTWYNIELDSGEKFAADMATQEYRKINEDAEIIMMVSHEILAVLVPRDRHNSDECIQAKFNELEKLKEFNTYTEVKDEGQERITTTWVMTEKGTETRARLTARGFQETADIPKDSPTMHKSSLRIVLALTAALGWKIETTDIRSAFLQGNDLDRIVYVKPPKEANAAGFLWLLNKCLYGLKDASKQWYGKVEDRLYKLGFKRADDDYGLFYLIKDGVLQGFIGLHVDDFIHAGNQYFINVIMPQVLSIFKVGKSEQGNFMYTGFKLNQNDDGITLDQRDYVERVQIPVLDTKRLLQLEEPMTEEELTSLRRMVGSLNWTVRSTRPDLAFDLINLSTKFKGGRVADLKAAKKTILRLKDEAMVRIPKIDLNTAELFLYTDASHGNLNEAKDSAVAYILFLVDPKSGRAAALDWKANKAKRVVHSTLAAEALSLYNGMDAAIATRKLLQDMTGHKYDLKLRAIIDNKDSYDTIHSSTNCAERRLRREIASIQECLTRKEVNSIIWVKGEHQLSDVLTKKRADRTNLLNVLQTGLISPESLAAIRRTY